MAEREKEREAERAVAREKAQADDIVVFTHSESRISKPETRVPHLPRERIGGLMVRHY
jgi:hypothetical protein